MAGAEAVHEEHAPDITDTNKKSGEIKEVDEMAEVKAAAGAEAVLKEDSPEETDTHETGETKKWLM